MKLKMPLQSKNVFLQLKQFTKLTSTICELKVGRAREADSGCSNEQNLRLDLREINEMDDLNDSELRLWIRYGTRWDTFTQSERHSEATRSTLQARLNLVFRSLVESARGLREPISNHLVASGADPAEEKGSFPLHSRNQPRKSHCEQETASDDNLDVYLNSSKQTLDNL